MVMYEDDISRTLALSLIPTTQLHEQSKQNGEVDRYKLLENLIRWFKTDFFLWVDVPACEKCKALPPKGSGEVYGSVRCIS